MPSVNHIIIDADKCIGCGRCVADCPGGHLYIDEKGKAKAKERGCIECGHCYAVCPEMAVTVLGSDESACGPVVPMSEFDSAKLLRAMQSRRSVRAFKNREVEREKLDMILEAGRCCPTGKNAQNVAYTVLGSRQEEIERECVEVFRRAQKLASFLGRVEIDEHFFFQGAPLVIAVSGDNDVDPSLAAAYMELMAESLGLGVLYCGYFTACCRMSARVRDMLSLPEGHHVAVCLVIGYPDVEYLRTAPRKSLKLRVL